MYIKYNTVLRSKTNDATVLRLAKELTKGNGYATTIHAINSCVIKLSKLTKAGKVWRGIKDAVCESGNRSPCAYCQLLKQRCYWGSIAECSLAESGCLKQCCCCYSCAG